MNPIQTVITHVGNASRLAAALGVTPQAVCFWRDGERKIPAEICPRIEEMTKGLVTCEDLRPDVNWHYIRGTAKASPAPTDAACIGMAPVAQGA